MKNILVIEDDAELRPIVCEMLRAENFDVIDAPDGQSGVQLAQALSPDLVICDILMPELNGYEVLRALRQEQITAIVPFIFLTAKVEKSDLRQAMELGADDYLTKPFTKDELIGAVTARSKQQSTRLFQYSIEEPRYQKLENELNRFKKNHEIQEKIFSIFLEKIRSSVTQKNMALCMMEIQKNQIHQEQYLKIFKEACYHETEALNHLSFLQDFLKPTTIDILRNYDLLKD